MRAPCTPFFLLTVTLGLSLATHVNAVVRFDSIAAFGDSWTDNGNGTWAQTNHAIPEDPAFWDGRFSDGPTWVEHLQTLLDTKKLLNFAHGGATINNSVAVGHPGLSTAVASPSVTDQVSTFLNSSLEEVDASKTLCVLLAGGNDMFWGGTDLDIRAITDSMVNNVGLLAAKGFHHFLVGSSYAMDLEPYFKMYGAIPNLFTFSPTFTANLDASLRAASLPKHVDLKLWDKRAALAEFIDETAKLGWVTDRPCLASAWGETPERALCDDPERHVFFDVVHPTTVAHQALARSAAALLARKPRAQDEL